MQNHENDVPIDDLRARMSEFNGVWLNSNMPDLDPKLPPSTAGKVCPYHIVEVEAGGQRRKVGLLGLLTVDKNLFRPGAFGGALDTAQSVVGAATQYRRLLLDEEGCDLVIPLTHQVMADDRAMAHLKIGFPLLVAGHDHDPYLELVDGCWIVKTGMDAAQAAIIDVTWPSSETPGEQPQISISLVRCRDYPENQELAAR